MSARHRFPGNDAGDSSSTVLTFDTAIDVSFEDDDKYRKRPEAPSYSLSTSSWSASNLSNKLSSFTASAINNINQTIAANSQPPLTTTNPYEHQLLRPSDTTTTTTADEIVVMASRDRTAEFGNAIRSMQGRNIQRAVNIRDPRKAKQMQSYSEFMGVAKLVGRNIASTYTKLEKLTLRKFLCIVVGLEIYVK